MSSPSDRLRAKIELMLPAFYQATARLWSREDLAELYPEYLVLMHQMVRATVPLMDAAIEIAAGGHAGDPVASGLSAYLSRHRREERGHDGWVAQDLELVCSDARSRLARMPGVEVASCVGSQYYWMRHHHPISLLGHIAVLEGYPPSPELAGVLQVRTGFPAAAFRTLQKHAVIDVFHSKEVFETVDALPLTTQHERVVGLSALHTLAGLVAAFDKLAGVPATAGVSRVVVP